MNNLNYQKVFSKLTHIKALSKKSKIEEILKNILLYSLVQEPNYPVINENDAAGLVSKVYGISLRPKHLLPSIDKILKSQEASRVNKKIVVSDEASCQIKKKIDDAKILEEQVKNIWFSELSQDYRETPQDLFEKIWECLKTYLSYAFEQYGVQTIRLFNLKNINKQDGKHLPLLSLAERALTKHNNIISIELFSDLINSFVSNTNEYRVNYIAKLADSSFTCYALATDLDTNNFLNNKFRGTHLFLDTNFIFGLLKLHDNPEDISANEIVNEIRYNRLQLHLVYHEETLSEFRRSFKYNTKILSGKKNWSPETSRIALQTTGLSAIERLFHEKNSLEQIDVETFLDKYEHIEKILADLGIKQYPYIPISDLEHGDIEYDINSYRDFYDNHPNRHIRKKKFDLQIKHDITVLRDVRNLNPFKKDILSLNAIFLSSDMSLSAFESKYYINPKKEVNTIITPTVFLHAIRPFIELDTQANIRFVEVFAIPDLRTFDIDYSGAKSIALQLIDDEFHGASFETKVDILRDDILLSSIKKAENIEIQRELIESFISTRNAELAEALSQKERNLKEKERNLESEAQEKNKYKELHQKGIEENAFLRSQIEKLSQSNEGIEQKEEATTPVSIQSNLKMNKKIVYSALFIFFLLATFLLLCNRSGKVKINKDGLEFEATEPKNNINKNIRFFLSGKLTVNNKPPSHNLISSIGIKGDTEVPESPLNGDSYLLENVSLPELGQLVIALKLYSGDIKYFQTSVIKTDLAKKALYPPLINLTIAENKTSKPSEVKAKDVNITLVGSDGNIIKVE